MRTRDSSEDPIQWPKKPVPPPGSTIGERIEYSMAEAVRRFLEYFDEPLAELGAWVIRLFIKILEKSTAGMVRPMLNMITDLDNLPPALKSYFEELKNPTGEGAMSGLMGLASGLGMNAASGLLAPIMRLLNYELDRIMETARPDPSALYPMIWRSPEIEGKAAHTMDELGWGGEWWKPWSEILRPRLPVDELTRWRLRDPGRAGVYKAELMKRGFPEDEIDKLEEMMWLIPPPQDIIRMAVREAWREDFAARWGMDQDLPGVAQEWAEKVGLDPDWFLRYWRSHWELPSLRLGYEMLHRGEISKEELSGLMRALDIMPGWRDPLINISYSPYTRVDTRRMHKVGVLEVDEVYRSYRDQGYDHEKGQKMTEFTVAFNMEDAREATKTDILLAYEEGEFTKSEAVDYLIDIGYVDWAASLYVEEVDRKKLMKRLNEVLKWLEIRFVNGDIGEGEIYDRLGEFALPDTQVREKIDLWQLKREQKAARPTVGKLEEFYTRDVIQLAELTDGLSKHRYSDQYVSWFVTNLNIEIAEKERKEAERLRKEQERIAKSEFRDERMTRLNELDIEIQEWKVNIADLKILIAQTVIPGEKERIHTQMRNLEAEIVKIRIKIAQSAEKIISLRDELALYVPPERVAEITAEIAELATQIVESEEQIAIRRSDVARLDEILLYLLDPDQRLDVAREIAGIKVEIADLKVGIVEKRITISTLKEEALTIDITSAQRALIDEIGATNITMAALRTQIEERRVLIADLKVKLSLAVEADEKRIYEEQIAAARAEVARLQLEKAEVPVLPG